MSSEQLNEESIRRLPPEIVEKLQLLIERMRKILWLRGTLAVAAVTLASILTIMAIDAAVTIFSQGVRWGLTLVALTAILAAGLRFLYAPLSRRYTLTRIARLIEIRHPELQERISSSVELLADENEERGSRRLIEELVREATEEAKHVSATHEFSKRSVLPYVVATGVVAGVLFILFALWPFQTSRLFARALAPYAEIGNVYSWRLRVSPGTVRVASGDALTISAAVSGPRLTRAELRREKPEGGDTVERMSRHFDEDDDVSRFSLDFPAVTQSFRYRVRAGRALSAYYRVEAIPRPDVASLALAYTFPEYTGMEARTDTNAMGDIVAPVGTRVELIASLNKPVSDADVSVNGDVVEGDEASEDAATHAWPLLLTPRMSGHWTLHLKDEYGFENPPLVRKLHAVPDRVPTVQLSSPQETELRMKPTDSLRINYLVRDDYGVAGVDLMVGLDGADPQPRSGYEVVRVEGSRGIWVGSIPVDLASLNLGKANTVRLRVRVADNLPEALNGPQLGQSKVIVIRIDRDAMSLAEQTIAAQAKEIKEQLEAVKERLEKAKTESDKEKDELTKEELDPDTRKAIEEIRHETATAEEAMRDLAERVEATEFAELADDMRETREDHVTPAREAADEIPLTDDATERREQTQDMRENLDQALADVDQMLADLEEAAENLDALAKLDDLAQQEELLAEQAREMMQDNAEMPADWLAEQQAAAEALAELLADQAEALAEELASQQQEAMDLAQDAQDLADQQDQLHDALEGLNPEQNREELRDALMDEVTRRQEALAQDTQELNKQAEQQNAEGQPPLDQAQAQTAQAAQELKEEQLSDARQAAQQAQEQLEQAAEQMEEAREQAADMEKAAENWEQSQEQAEMAEAAENLAERQEQLVDAMEALEKGNLEQAMAALQEAITEQAAELAGEMADLQERAQDLGMPEPISTAAEDAARDMAAAEQQAEQAEGLLEKGLDPAPPAAQGQQAPPPPGEQALAQQDAAAENMRGAAENLQEMGQQLANLMEGLPVGEQPLMDPAMMADALEQAYEAAAAPAPLDAAMAAQAAAQNLQQASMMMAQQLGMQLPQMSRPSAMPSMPGNMPNQQNQGPMVPVGLGELPEMLKKLGLTNADWARLKGEIQSEVAGTAGTAAPAEYRELVKRYFEEVARRGAEESE